MQCPEQTNGEISWDWDGERAAFQGSDLSRLEHLASLHSLDLCGCKRLTDLSPLEPLASLQWVNLSSCGQLTDLSPLVHLTSLQSLNLSWCRQLTDVSALDRLASLQWLKLSSCWQLTELPSLERLTSLQSLNLSSSWQLTELTSLERLTSLQSLDLSGCEQLTDLSPLKLLASLQSLNLSWCQQLTEISPLNQLTSLRSLALSRCNRLTDLSVLERLTSLQSLNLSSCEQLTMLPPLGHLVSLQSLNLSGCKQLTKLPPLEHLASLQSLNLSSCEKLTELPPLEYLTSLQSLNLSSCEQLTKLPPLKHLTSLRLLDLHWCQQLTRLPLLEHLTSLQSLNLAGCNQLTDISSLEHLTSLRSLDLSRCDRLTDLSPLKRLTSLQSLDLSLCRQITDLLSARNLTALKRLSMQGLLNVAFEPVRAILDGLTELKLHGANFTDLIPELTGQSYVENVLGKVRAHFADLESGAARETEVKVFVLGNGRVGKTQLVRQLMHESYDENVRSTHGIQCRHRDELHLVDWESVRLNIWDFGGQDIYHGSHALFLHGQAIFLLLWSPDCEEGEWHEGGMTMQNRPLSYWLDYVHTLAGRDCPVLVIQSQCDTRDRQLPASIPDQHDFVYLRQFPFSAKTRLGLEELKGQLRAAAEAVLIGHHREIGVGRAEVRRVLRAYLEEDQKLPRAQRKHRKIPKSTYEQICDDVDQKIGRVTNPDALLDFLHQSGVVYYRPHLFDGRIILDQEWALDAIYALFHRAEVLPHLIQSGGRFTRKLLEDLLWGKTVDEKGPYSADEQTLFLEMMQSCGICFRANPKFNEEHQWTEAIYAAPELLPAWDQIRRNNFSWTKRIAPDAWATLRYRFLHEGIFRGLLAKLGQHAGPGAHYGKQGCGFHDLKTDSDILIEAFPLETCSQPGAGELRFRAWGPDAKNLIETLLKSVPPMTVKPPETEYSWARGNDVSESPRLPQQEPTIEDLRPVKGKIYLSYAWGEESELRQQAADAIVAKIEEWGYEPVFDKRQMKLGDLISEFMKEIARSQKVIVVLSAKYLRSRYCVDELNLIDMHALREAKEFHGKVIPIVLDDAQIHDEKSRLTHTRYWKAKHTELKADIDGMGPSDREFVRKYAEWSDHLGEILFRITDQLSPQRIKELDEIDFEKVRERLERQG